MLKLNNKVVVLLASFLVAITVTACSSEKEQAPVKETKVAEVTKKKVKKEVEPTLAEQGLSLGGYEIDP